MIFSSHRHVIGPLSGHVLICALLFLGFMMLRRWPRAFAMAMLVGTLAHELMHWSVGFVLAAQPVFISVMPRQVRKGDWLLGEVRFKRLRWWNTLPVSLAPLALLPISIWIFYCALFFDPYAWPSIVLKVLAVQLFISAWPSPKDLHHAMTALAVIMGAGGIILFLWWWVHRLPF